MANIKFKNALSLRDTTHTQTERHTETETHRGRHTHRDRHTHKDRHTQRHTSCSLLAGVWTTSGTQRTLTETGTNAVMFLLDWGKGVTTCTCHVPSPPNLNSRFLAAALWMCAEQNVTVGVPESEGRRSRPRTMSTTMPHVPLLVESSLKAKTTGSGSNVSLLSKMARSVLPVYATN